MNSQALQESRNTREKTFALLNRLNDSHFYDRGGEILWSPADIADHLRRSDQMYTREIRKLVDLATAGKKPFVSVSLSEMDFSLPLIPHFLLPAADIPFGVFNFFLPGRAREWVISNPIIRAEAPPVLRPHPEGTPDQLKQRLKESLKDLENLFLDHLDLDFKAMRYYHPVFGYNNAYSIVGLLTSHEERHQKQLARLIDELPAEAVRQNQTAPA